MNLRASRSHPLRFPPCPTPPLQLLPPCSQMAEVAAGRGSPGRSKRFSLPPSRPSSPRPSSSLMTPPSTRSSRGPPPAEASWCGIPWSSPVRSSPGTSSITTSRASSANSILMWVPFCCSLIPFPVFMCFPFLILFPQRCILYLFFHVNWC